MSDPKQTPDLTAEPFTFLPEGIARETLAIVQRCGFQLDDLMQRLPPLSARPFLKRDIEVIAVEAYCKAITGVFNMAAALATPTAPCSTDDLVQVSRDVTLVAQMVEGVFGDRADEAPAPPG